MPERFLQFTHLRADGLGHIQPFRRAGEAAFLHDDPEIVQVTIVEHCIRPEWNLSVRKSQTFRSIIAYFPTDHSGDDRVLRKQSNPLMEYLLSLAADPAAWAALITLIVMEVVLGIDNLVFISILSNKLPREQRARSASASCLRS